MIIMVMKRKLIKKIIAEEQKKFFANLTETNNNFEKKENELNEKKAKLLNQKEASINERNEVEEKILKISNEISSTLGQLKLLFQRINDIAMNNNHLEIEQKYIKNLKEQMDVAGVEDEEKEKYLKKMEEKVRISIEVNKLADKDIFKIDDTQIASKLGINYETADGTTDSNTKIN